MPHPLRQGRDLALEPLSAPGRGAYNEYMARTAAVVADPLTHRRFWEQEARELFRRFRQGLPQLAAALNAEDASVAQRAARGLYNTFRCDAHHASRQTGLQLMHER